MLRVIEFWMASLIGLSLLGIDEDEALAEYGIVVHRICGWIIAEDFTIKSFKELINECG